MTTARTRVLSGAAVTPCTANPTPIASRAVCAARITCTANTARALLATIALATLLLLPAFAAPQQAVALEAGTLAPEDQAWEATDFTYGWWAANYEDEDVNLTQLDIHPAANSSDRLSVKARAVTGFSEAGLAKLQDGLTDLVIPDKDDQGNQIQAVGNSAFSSSSINKKLPTGETAPLITSVAFPEGVMAPFNAQDMGSPSLWNEDATERGNFWIGASAFGSQGITGSLVLPEGVIYLGPSAFARNNSLDEVVFPTTITWIGGTAFGSVDTANKVPTGNISSLSFPDETIFPLQLASQAFSGNKITETFLPTNMSCMDALTFLMNTGAGEPIVPGDNANVNALAEKGTIVKLCVTDMSKLGPFVSDKNNFDRSRKAGVQEVVQAERPQDPSAWTCDHFTFEEAGTVVTGLTEAGQAKLKETNALVIPDKGPDGQDVVAIGEGQFSTATPDRAGTFGFKEGDTWYYPATVELPARLREIRKGAFSGVYIAERGEDGATHEQIVCGLTAITLPDTLTTIGEAAFNWSLLTKVDIPDSVTSIGNGAFSTAQTLPGALVEAKLPAGITEIPDYLFNNQELRTIEIPDSVKTIGKGAFRENPIETLAIPSSVEEIGKYAFQGNALTELTIPGNVKRVGGYAFNVSGHHGGSLAKLTLGEGIEFIGERAFQGASLTQVDVPTTLVELVSRAFNNNKNAGREDSRVVLVSKVYDQARGQGAYAKFVTDETFTMHYGGGHLTLLDLSSAQAVMSPIPDQDYVVGKPAEPAVSLKWVDPDGAEHALEPETDYALTYENNTKVGTAAIARVTGKGIFMGEKAMKFNIKATIAVPKAKAGLTYTGSAQVGVAAGEGYALSGTSKATKAGKYTATAKLAEGYVWADGTYDDKAISWSIAAASIAKAKVTLKKASGVYNGKAQKGAVKSVVLNKKALKASDYSVSAKSGKKAGSYTVTVTGKGNYKGKATATYKVTKAAAKAAVTKAKAYTVAQLKKAAASFVAVKLTTDGKAAWKVTKNSSKKYVAFSAGKVTVKKGAPKGKYTLSVKVSAKAGTNYKALAAKAYTITVTVK